MKFDILTIVTGLVDDVLVIPDLEALSGCLDGAD